MAQDYSEINELSFFLNAIICNPNKIEEILAQYENLDKNISRFNKPNAYINEVIIEIRNENTINTRADMSKLAKFFTGHNNHKLKIAGKLMKRWMC